jgi:drug/metabolite transporter (DMT)-like permease
MGIILAVSSAFLIGISNFFLKKSFKDFPPSVAFFILSVCGLLLWAPVGLMLGVEFHQWLFGALVGLLSAILGQAIYIYVLEKGELSITGTILETFAVYTIIFSMLFNHEKPTLLTLLFIAMTIIGTIIVSLPDKIKKNELRKVNYILWAVFAAICIGASDTVSKYFINHVSVGSFLFYVAFAQFFVSIAYLKLEKQSLAQFKEVPKRLSEYKFALLGSLFVAIATMCLFLSFNFLLASIASPIAASGPIVTVILAVVFLHERASPKTWIGLLLVLISLVCIGIVNP